MNKWRRGAFLTLLLLMLTACGGDPSGPRIPEPDQEEEQPDPDQTFTRLLMPPR